MTDATISHNIWTKRNYGEPSIYGQIGLWKVNLFPLHLGKKEGFKGSKAEISVDMVRFCKVCLSLGCIYHTTLYGTRSSSSSSRRSIIRRRRKRRSRCCSWSWSWSWRVLKGLRRLVLLWFLWSLSIWIRKCMRQFTISFIVNSLLFSAHNFG